MHLTRRLFVAVVIAISSHGASAKTDPECLKHLGGGFSDAECFAGLRVNIVEENKLLYKKIRAKVPVGNEHAKVLDAYMAAQDNAEKFCELQRDAGAGWETNPDGSMYTALYERCVFELRTVQNKFLMNLLTMANW
ncbi:hypothetical protein BCY88_25735 [Paraburkholderia fungorum]|uniref:Lysozyme inhibitor LprI N-terminal domain-containing protein n=2 Tax=Paraburkholderia fungorum TaxID=134537 RepID=A0A420GMA8_9BURK|nr:hypothetical protein BCY88_25735 [Paraburkholderia fungorum]